MADTPPAEAPKPAPLRPSTTVLLIRDGADGLEVLMVVRGDDKGQYASAMVFPGGTLDAEDADEAWLAHLDGADGLDPAERARRIAGFRELFEETGVLLIEAPQRAPPAAGERSFLDVVRDTGGRLDLEAMIPFAHWVTPEGAPKRYDTYFRLCWRTTEMTAVSDGRETVSVEWLKPSQALALGAAGQRNVLFPTKCQLDLLAQSATVEQAVAAARARRIVPVSPTMERRPEGTVLSIPPESGYPEREFVMARPFG
jgi:8-oxo-dGTP pyrophosphatase MutT (NUDIX family)